MDIQFTLMITGGIIAVVSAIVTFCILGSTFKGDKGVTDMFNGFLVACFCWGGVGIGAVTFVVGLIVYLIKLIKS